MNRTIVRGGNIMLKLVLNEDFVHSIDIDNYNQSTVLSITNYSTHSTSITFVTRADSIANVMTFENTPITGLRIRDDAGETLLNLNLTDKNVYVLNYNTSIYNGGQNTSVSLGQVAVAAPENSEGEGE